MFKHVLIPTDGSEVGTKVVMEGIDLAKALGANITLLTVLRPFHTFALSPEMVTETASEHRHHEEEHQRQDIALAQDAARTAGLHFQHITAESDHLSDAVIHAAKDRDCDLVVMPAHERAGLLRTSHMDSETLKLLTRSELPVLVLH
jgi:nucleotide-binding universal stress UspA family protein